MHSRFSCRLQMSSLSFFKNYTLQRKCPQQTWQKLVAENKLTLSSFPVSHVWKNKELLWNAKKNHIYRKKYRIGDRNSGSPTSKLFLQNSEGCIWFKAYCSKHALKHAAIIFLKHLMVVHISKSAWIYDMIMIHLSPYWYVAHPQLPVLNKTTHRTYIVGALRYAIIYNNANI